MAPCLAGGKVKRQAMLAAAFLVSVALLAAPEPLPAQTPLTGFTSVGGANSKKPIDIESDRLEVDDKTHVAIFTGNVTAVQGDYTLRAPRLEVTYDKAAEAGAQEQGGAQTPKTVKVAKPVNASADASTDPLSSSQIKFVHATGGKVVVVSKVDEQEATGDDIIYDVKGQKITMTGKDVILTQKKNVVKGKEMDIDLATGRATVIPQHGRVQAILAQDDVKGATSGNPLTGAKKKNSHPAAEALKPPSGANWQTQIIEVFRNGLVRGSWFYSINVNPARSRAAPTNAPAFSLFPRRLPIRGARSVKKSASSSTRSKRPSRSGRSSKASAST